MSQFSDPAVICLHREGKAESRGKIFSLTTCSVKVLRISVQDLAKKLSYGALKSPDRVVLSNINFS